MVESYSKNAATITCDGLLRTRLWRFMRHGRKAGDWFFKELENFARKEEYIYHSWNSRLFPFPNETIQPKNILSGTAIGFSAHNGSTCARGLKLQPLGRNPEMIGLPREFLSLIIASNHSLEGDAVAVLSTRDETYDFVLLGFCKIQIRLFLPEILKHLGGVVVLDVLLEWSIAKDIMEVDAGNEPFIVVLQRLFWHPTLNNPGLTASQFLLEVESCLRKNQKNCLMLINFRYILRQFSKIDGVTFIKVL